MWELRLSRLSSAAGAAIIAMCAVLVVVRVCAAGLSDQSMALAFLVDANVDNPLIQKLAAWVAQGAAPPPLFYAAICVSSSPWDALLRSQALTSYDSSTANLTPDLKVTVNAQPQPSLTGKRAPVTLLSSGFTPQEAGKLANSSTGWDEVPPNSTLVVSAQGSGEVSVAAALNFTPADLLPFPTYRGLWVQRVLLLEQSGSVGSSSSAAVDAGIGLGKIVTMAVQVGTRGDSRGASRDPSSGSKLTQYVTLLQYLFPNTVTGCSYDCTPALAAAIAEPAQTHCTCNKLCIR